ncbi:MAG: cyclic nucleotide-binding and patatin-like phospholipase domain-containing protein [Bacteroidota bacterium]
MNTTTQIKSVPNKAPKPLFQLPDAANIRPLLKEVLRQNWGDLENLLVEQVIHHLEWETLSCGELLYREGDVGDCMHILISGRLKAFRNHTGQQMALGEISTGECVGETSLLSDAPRNASIYAIRDSILVKMTKAQFDVICNEHPQLLRQVSKVVIQRFSNDRSGKQKQAKIKNIALFPLSPTVDIQVFADKLSKQINEHGRVKIFNQESINKELQEADLQDFSSASLNDLHFFNWQEKIEQQFDYILYQAEHQNNLWTQTCIRQADMILLVGNFDEFEKTDIETQLFERTNKLSYVSKRLILLHEDADKEPIGTCRHLSIREVDIHHHIRWQKQEDFKRLARFVTGRTIGLVLAGGGAKGLAHLGVYKRLCESGIDIDFVGGTSIGAAIAGAIAMDLSLEELIQQCRSAFVTDKPLSDRTLPVVSIISGNRLDRVMQKYYGDRDIEDQWLNFFCVSSNYSHPSTVIHRSGKFWKSIRASLSIPGALPPVVSGNDLLVDGGLMNNFPIDIMASYQIGKIIAVSLSEEKTYELGYDKIPNSRKLLQNKFASKKKRIKVPSLTSIIFKSTILASHEKGIELRKLADLLITPPVGRFGLLDFKKFDKIFKIGYEHTDTILRDRPEILEEIKTYQL